MPYLSWLSLCWEEPPRHLIQGISPPLGAAMTGVFPKMAPTASEPPMAASTASDSATESRPCRSARTTSGSSCSASTASVPLGRVIRSRRSTAAFREGLSQPNRASMPVDRLSWSPTAARADPRRLSSRRRTVSQSHRTTIRSMSAPAGPTRSRCSTTWRSIPRWIQSDSRVRWPGRPPRTDVSPKARRLAA